MRNGKRVENILHFRELMQTVSWKCGEQWTVCVCVYYMWSCTITRVLFRRVLITFGCGFYVIWWDERYNIICVDMYLCMPNVCQKPTSFRCAMKAYMQ